MLIKKACRRDLKQLLAWLYLEQQEREEGFFCNAPIIREALKTDELFCAVVGSEVLGFVIHTRKLVGSSIDILEVHPRYRGRGIGSSLAVDAVDRLLKQQAEFISVQCAPKSSASFWERLGFRATEEDSPSTWGRLVLHLSNSEAANLVEKFRRGSSNRLLD